MKSAVRDLIRRVRSDATPRPGAAVSRMMGRERTFHAWDLGEDTFVFEDGIWNRLEEHASVLVASKADLARRSSGHLLTVSSGNHAVAALPLLSGTFWQLARIAAARRGKVLTESILCANVVDGRIEVSQRDVPLRRLVAADAWLRRCGLGLDAVVMAERSDSALDYYRRIGQEWRVKPLAWTRREMDAALAASRKRISTTLQYYHSAKGVHFLAYPEFHAFAQLARTDFAAFTAALHELVSVYEGTEFALLRQPKFHGHHEVELFGLRRGEALERIVPELEKLMEAIVLRKIPAADVPARVDAIDALFRASLSRPALADASSKDFVETLYMYLTGEIYAVLGEGSAPAFDDHRTALPGATFENGRPRFHPGCDARSEVLLSNIRGLMSKDEVVEYANVYELRTDDDAEAAATGLGLGKTREIVFKTNRRPLETSLVEKRLSRHEHDYGSYMLARVEAFKALGAGLADYRLLRRRALAGRQGLNFYIRSRCAGEPSGEVPASYFQMSGEFGGREAGEDPQVLLAFAALMGDAAAQNLAMKKFDPVARDCRYGVGKEIYEFAYDIKAMRVMPRNVSVCSVRGTLGWEDLSYTEENINRIFDFYLGTYAAVLRAFSVLHPSVPLADLGRRFFDGFEFRSRAMEWTFTVHRDEFEAFDPRLPGHFGFLRKWRFALWSLERQVRRLDALREAFGAKLGGASAAVPPPPPPPPSPSSNNPVAP